MQHQLVISEIAPCGWSSYFPLPKEKRNPGKGLSNIQHEDNECFRWCLIRYVNPVNKNLANADKEFPKQLDFNAIKFTVHEKRLRWNRNIQNNISINMFSYEDETPYCIYTSKQTFEKLDNFWLLSNSKNYQYVLIKDFNKFVINKIKYHSKYIDIGYNFFLAEEY